MNSVKDLLKTETGLLKEKVVQFLKEEIKPEQQQGVTDAGRLLKETKETQTPKRIITICMQDKTPTGYRRTVVVLLAFSLYIQQEESEGRSHIMFKALWAKAAWEILHIQLRRDRTLYTAEIIKALSLYIEGTQETVAAYQLARVAGDDVAELLTYGLLEKLEETNEEKRGADFRTIETAIFTLFRYHTEIQDVAGMEFYNRTFTRLLRTYGEEHELPPGPYLVQMGDSLYDAMVATEAIKTGGSKDGQSETEY